MRKGENHINVWEKRISDKKKDTYQNLQRGTSLVCSRNRKRINVATGFKRRLCFTLLLASLVAQLVKNQPATRETWFNPWGGKTPWRREQLPTPVFWPREYYGLYSPWGHRELDTTERLSCSIYFSKK